MNPMSKTVRIASWTITFPGYSYVEYSAAKAFDAVGQGARVVRN